MPDPTPGVGFVYDASTRTATWKFSNWGIATQHDHFLLSLSDDVVSVAGTLPLDGEWTNPSRLFVDPAAVAPPYFEHAAISVFPSGNGQSGGDFNFFVSLLAGDANLNNFVSINPDILRALANIGATNMTFTNGDFNGDGTVNIGADVLPANANIGVSLILIHFADFDQSGTVDAADLDIWEANYLTGPTHEQGDANLDGAVDGADFDLWQSQLGWSLRWAA